MGEVFLKLLNMSITASWLIVAILCIRLLFRKMPKWVNCLLWAVVAVRLAFPFSVESVFSLQPSAEPIQSSTVVGGETVLYVPAVDSNLSVVENTINPILAESFAYEQTDSVAPLQVLTEVAGVVWMAGMIVLLGFAVVSMVRLAIMVKESVLYKDNAYICDAVKSPFILGIIRPRIYLSSSLSNRLCNNLRSFQLSPKLGGSSCNFSLMLYRIQLHSIRKCLFTWKNLFSLNVTVYHSNYSIIIGHLFDISRNSRQSDLIYGI